MFKPLLPLPHTPAPYPSNSLPFAISHAHGARLGAYSTRGLRLRRGDARPCSQLPPPALEARLPSVLEGLMPGWILISGRRRPYDKVPQSRAYLNVEVGAAASRFRPRHFAGSHGLELRNGYALGPEIVLQEPAGQPGWSDFRPQPV